MRRAQPSPATRPSATSWGGSFIVILPELDAGIVATDANVGTGQEGLAAFLDDPVRG